MVAYNLMLSVFPLALVALFVAGRVLSSEDIEASVVDDLQRLFPAAAESTLSTACGGCATPPRRWGSSRSSPPPGSRARSGGRWTRRSAASTTASAAPGCGRSCSRWGCSSWCCCSSWRASRSRSLQGVVVNGAEDLPLGLGDVRGRGLRPLARGRPGAELRRSSASSTGACRAARSRGAACGRARRARRSRWASWTTRFPLYLQNVTSLRIGTSFVFVLIVLVWFYALAIILLAGAVVNELRFEGATRRPQAAELTGR